MSAYLVHARQIDALITCAEEFGCLELSYLAPSITGRPQPITATRSTEDQIGQALHDQNAEGVSNRYGDQPSAPVYKFRPYDFGHLPEGCNEAVFIIKQAQNLAYQCDNDDSYGRSWTAAWLRQLISTAIYNLPGYDAAPWGIDG